MRFYDPAHNYMSVVPVRSWDNVQGTIFVDLDFGALELRALFESCGRRVLCQALYNHRLRLRPVRHVPNRINGRLTTRKRNR